MTEANPLAIGLPAAKSMPPCAIVIFGASGDLAARKILPALWHLHEGELLPDRFAVIGVARTSMSDDDFRDYTQRSIREYGDGDNPKGLLWESFAERISYLSGDYSDTRTYDALEESLSDADRLQGTAGNRLFYLATPPALFTPILDSLHESKLAKRKSGPAGAKEDEAFTRIVIEKPFGTDFASARRLNNRVVRAVGEKQVYRIDHYLGKETVQNLLVFRFANTIFEPVWNRRYIDHVQITAAETVGVEGRAGYYDKAGALRDMFQNHMLQLLCLVATEPPTRFDSRSVRDEKSKALEAVRPLSEAELVSSTVRAQYRSGAIAGEPVPGYLEETGVDSASKAETYAALRLYVDNWRFAGVPFFLRSGKRLAKRTTEIAITFREVPHMLFGDFSTGPIAPNVLTIRIQPDEGITLDLEAKVPGMSMRMRPVHMDFRYGTAFGKRSPEAYERLILDALAGDQMLFARGDWLETSWRLIDPVIEAWAAGAAPLSTYEAGTMGPQESELMLGSEGREWRRL